MPTILKEKHFDKYVIYFDGACGSISEDDNLATFGFTVSKNNVLVHEGWGVVGVGRDVTNNVAEFGALIKALEYLRQQPITGEVYVYGDSKLVINQVKLRWRVLKPHLVPLVNYARALSEGLYIYFQHVPRERNVMADALSKRAYKAFKLGYDGARIQTETF